MPRPPHDRSKGRPRPPAPGARARPHSGRAAGAARTGAPRDAPPRAPKGSAGRSLADQVRAAARPGQAERAAKAFELAADLLQRGRDRPALTAAEEAKALAPRSGPVREVLGMALYRNERYRDALRELQAYRRMTGRPDQNHLIADSYRALGMPEKAVVPAQEAIRSTASDEVRSEAAVVGASALADLGRYTEALALLRSYRGREKGVRPPDLRRWYVTGDVLERAGRRDEAAEEFRRVVRYEAGAFDAAERLANLG